MCRKLCQDLVKVDASNEEASIMLADIMFRNDEVDVRVEWRVLRYAGCS
jgi:hypothetical protein